MPTSISDFYMPLQGMRLPERTEKKSGLATILELLEKRRKREQEEKDFQLRKAESESATAVNKQNLKLNQTQELQNKLLAETGGGLSGYAAKIGILSNLGRFDEAAKLQEQYNSLLKTAPMEEQQAALAALTQQVEPISKEQAQKYFTPPEYKGTVAGDKIITTEMKPFERPVYTTENIPQTPNEQKLEQLKLAGLQGDVQSQALSNKLAAEIFSDKVQQTQETTKQMKADNDRNEKMLELDYQAKEAMTKAVKLGNIAKEAELKEYEKTGKTKEQAKAAKKQIYEITNHINKAKALKAAAEQRLKELRITREKARTDLRSGKILLQSPAQKTFNETTTFISKTEAVKVGAEATISLGEQQIQQLEGNIQQSRIELDLPEMPVMSAPQGSSVGDNIPFSSGTYAPSNNGQVLTPRKVVIDVNDLMRGIGL